jgi:hypothetical protein
MALLDEIIGGAVDSNVSVGALLRKCLLLAHQVKNDKFNTWLNFELDGYTRDEDLPDYRIFHCINKGIFLGVAYRLADQPLSLHVMEPDDRKIVEKVHLRQPAAAYEGRPNKHSDAALPWPPYLTTKYQIRFFDDKDLVLNRAWQEIPGSVLVGLLEQIRTRVLRFALELKEALPQNADDPKEVPSSVIERSVVNHIYGGNILIASHAEDFTQLSHMVVAPNDTKSLLEALKSLGVTEAGIAKLSTDIEMDRKDGEPTIGPGVKKWLGEIGGYITKEGAKAGIDVAKQMAIKWLMQHAGIGAI